MTVGALTVQPNVTNVIAGETTFNIDFRAADEVTRAEMQGRIEEILAQQAAAQACELHIAATASCAPGRDEDAHTRGCRTGRSRGRRGKYAAGQLGSP